MCFSLEVYAQESKESLPREETGQQSKKIGPLLINMEKIVVSKGQVSVYIAFYNGSEETEFRLGKDYKTGIPTLVDDKGNTFSFEQKLSGLPDYGAGTGYGLSDPANFKHFGFALPPKSANEMVLVFVYKEDISIDALGDYFSVNLKYVLFNSKDGVISAYSVSFTDIIARKPR
jgi:hypothetical protein